MKPLAAGQAAVARFEGKVSFIACDDPKNLPLGPVRFEIKAVMHEITVSGTTVPVVVAVIRLISADASRYYAAWIDEQQDGALELLAAQPDLPIVLATPFGERFGSATTENGMRGFARKTLGVVAKLTSKAPWTPKYFDAAKMAVMAMYFSASELWGRLHGE